MANKQLATPNIVYTSLYNEILYKKLSNEMDLALFDEELKMHGDKESDRKEAVLLTRGKLEAQVITQDKALEWLLARVEETKPLNLFERIQKWLFQ